MVTEPARKPLLVRVLQGETVERPPVWAMRQAGRWDEQFRALRARRGFYEFSENAELAARASLCPQRFGVDAIILFYDITTLAVAMGQRFALLPEQGPVPEKPIRTMADVKSLTSSPATSSYRAVLETLRLVRQEVGEELAILVFAGAPYTLATYQIGTGKNQEATRRFFVEQPAVWRALLEKIATATTGFLGSLLEAGAVAYQLFDSWAGTLSRPEYEQYAQPYHQQIFSSLARPGILFVKESPYLDLQAVSGARVLSLGVTSSLKTAKRLYPHLVMQGNVDHTLLVEGTVEQVREATRVCLQESEGQGHILNLDHGMDRRAKPENFAAFVDTVRIH